MTNSVAQQCNPSGSFSGAEAALRTRLETGFRGFKEKRVYQVSLVLFVTPRTDRNLGRRFLLDIDISGQVQTVDPFCTICVMIYMS